MERNKPEWEPSVKSAWHRPDSGRWVSRESAWRSRAPRIPRRSTRSRDNSDFPLEQYGYQSFHRVKTWRIIYLKKTSRRRKIVTLFSTQTFSMIFFVISSWGFFSSFHHEFCKERFIMRNPHGGMRNPRDEMRNPHGGMRRKVIPNVRDWISDSHNEQLFQHVGRNAENRRTGKTVRGCRWRPNDWRQYFGTSRHGFRSNLSNVAADEMLRAILHKWNQWMTRRRAWNEKKHVNLYNKVRP